MKEMVSHALKQKLAINFIWTHKKFKRILIGDSTQFELPPLFKKFTKEVEAQPAHHPLRFSIVLI